MRAFYRPLSLTDAGYTLERACRSDGLILGEQRVPHGWTAAFVKDSWGDPIAYFAVSCGVTFDAVLPQPRRGLCRFAR